MSELERECLRHGCYIGSSATCPTCLIDPASVTYFTFPFRADADDLTIRKAQRNQPWTVPYSDGVVEAEGSCVPHILGTHTALHAAKTVGKLCATFEEMDHPAGANANAPRMPTSAQREAIRAASADLVAAALRLANLYSFDLQDAMVERVVEKNGRGFD